MIEKKALIELVRRRANGELQSKDLGKVGDQIVAYYIGRVYNAMLSEILAKKFSNIDPYTKEYTDIPINKNEATNIYYSLLPEKIINIPRRAGNGVISIRGMQSESIEFAPMQNNTFRIIDGLDVDMIDDVVGYIYKGDRVEYKGMTPTIASGTVKMELVIPFEAYENKDNIVIPTGTDEVLIRRVIDLIMGTPDADKINNSNSLNQNRVKNG
jgi:hypothetical protein